MKDVMSKNLCHDQRAWQEHSLSTQRNLYSYLDIGERERERERESESERARGGEIEREIGRGRERQGD